MEMNTNTISYGSVCRLITPPGGKILDPWTGSGSTGCAAVEEGFSFIGIDMNPDHITTASARIAFSHKKAANDNNKG